MKVLFLLALSAVAMAAPVKDAPAEDATAEPEIPSGTFLYRGLPFAPSVYTGANWLGGSPMVYGQNPAMMTYGAPLTTTYGAPLTTYGAALTTYGAPLTTYGAPMTYTAGLDASMMLNPAADTKLFHRVMADGRTTITQIKN